MKYQEHIPISYAYKVVSDIPDYPPPLEHELCENTAEKFLEEMKKLSDHIMTEYILKQKPKPELKDLTEEEKQRHNTENCHICGEAFRQGRNIPKNEKRVIDHEHFTLAPGKTFGKYCGPAHSI